MNIDKRLQRLIERRGEAEEFNHILENRMKIQAHTRLEARDAKQASIALDYFQKIFGKYTGKEAFDPDNDLGEDYTGAVQFKDKKTRDCKMVDIELVLDPEGLMFKCDFVYEDIEDIKQDEFLVSASTGAALIAKFKKEIASLIKSREQQLKKTKITIDFLNSLV